MFLLSEPGQETLPTLSVKAIPPHTRPLALHFSKTTNEPIPDSPYTIQRKDGSVIRGKTDAQGLTQSVELDDLEPLDSRFEAEEETYA